MRKIDQIASKYFMGDMPLRSGNTKVEVNDELTTLYLHNHPIAQKTYGNNSFKITNAGYKTDVTKHRLNSLPGVSIYQKKGEWFLNGEKWDGQWITIR